MKAAITGQIVGMLGSKFKQSERLDKRKAFDIMWELPPRIYKNSFLPLVQDIVDIHPDLQSQFLQKNNKKNEQEFLPVLSSGVINKLKTINQSSGKYPMKAISSAPVMSPRSQLREIVQEAKIPDNKLEKQLRRERDYSPSAINLSQEALNTRLQQTYPRDIDNLKAIIEKGKRAYNKAREKQFDESINERKDYESLINKINEYENKEPWIRTNKEQFGDVVDDIDKLTLRMEGAYTGDPLYSPRNNAQDQQVFFDKREIDLRQAEREAIEKSEQMEKIIETFSWKDVKEPFYLEGHKKYSDVSLPRFNKYYEKELPRIENNVSREFEQPNNNRASLINQIQQNEDIRRKFYLENKIGAITYSYGVNPLLAEHYKLYQKTRELSNILGIPPSTFDQEISAYNGVENLTDRIRNYEIKELETRSARQHQENVRRLEEEEKEIESLGDRLRKQEIQSEQDIEREQDQPQNNGIDLIQNKIDFLKSQRPTTNHMIIARENYKKAGQTVPPDLEKQWSDLMNLNAEIKKLEDQIKNNLLLAEEEKELESLSDRLSKQEIKSIQPGHPSSKQISELKQLINKRHNDVKDWSNQGQVHPQAKETLWAYNTLKNKPDSDPLWKDFFNQNRQYITDKSIPVIQEDKSQQSPITKLSQLQFKALQQHMINLNNSGNREPYLDFQGNQWRSLDPLTNPTNIELWKKYYGKEIKPIVHPKPDVSKDYPVYVPVHGYIQTERTNLIKYLYRKMLDLPEYLNESKADLEFLNSTTRPDDIERLVRKHSKAFYKN